MSKFSKVVKNVWAEYRATGSESSPQNMQALAEKIKSKPQVLKELEEALIIHNEIKKDKRQIDQLEKERLKLEKHIEKWKANPQYRPKQRIVALKKKLQEIEAVATTMNEIMGDGDKIGKQEHVCPICYDSPIHVFSCEECDNWICGNCRVRVDNCPTCRTSFEEKSPRRNKTVERLLRNDSSQGSLRQTDRGRDKPTPPRKPDRIQNMLRSNPNMFRPTSLNQALLAGAQRPRSLQPTQSQVDHQAVFVAGAMGDAHSDIYENISYFGPELNEVLNEMTIQEHQSDVPVDL